MKVKVRIIKPPYTDVPTESLQAILCDHAHNRLRAHISTKQLYEIMGVLAERRKASGFHYKTDEEALAEFIKYYMPKEHRPLFIDYAGEYDHALLELSDVLPAYLYDERTANLGKKEK